MACNFVEDASTGSCDGKQVVLVLAEVLLPSLLAISIDVGNAVRAIVRGLFTSESKLMKDDGFDIVLLAALMLEFNSCTVCCFFRIRSILMNCSTCPWVHSLANVFIKCFSGVCACACN